MPVTSGLPKPCTRNRDERGAVAIMVAISVTILLIVTAMVLDFGLARLDRQRVKLVADSAVMSGLRAADNGNGQVYTFKGVCGALGFLKANAPSLTGLPAGVCATPDPSAVCDPANPSTNAAAYTGTSTSGGVTTEVTIKLPYLVSDGAFPEESYAAVSGDTSTANGCDQLGVIIKQSRKPGLGSLATSGDLVLRQRSVGRVQTGDGELAPALLLLERTACDVLTVGSAGSPSRIKVYGSLVTDVPGTIHADSNATGSDCGSGSNQQVFQGKQNDGVVAYGSLSGKAGIITSVARLNGVAANIVSDDPAYVYGTTAANESGTGTTTSVSPRAAVTRKDVDERYLPGVTAKVRDAYVQWNLDDTSPTGYTRFLCPTPAEMTTMAGMDATDAVYIDCPGSSGITLDGTIGAGRIYFHGFIKGGKLRMPNATQVLVDNTNDSGARVSAQAIGLSNNTGFCIGASVCDTLGDAGQCTASTTTAQADLIIRRGSIETSGGLVRLCNTTVILEGGQFGLGTPASPGGCLPTTPGEAPTATPCPGASDPAGDGLVAIGGASDWTAPNQFADMDALGLTDAQKQAAWDAGEDLALWTETYGDGPDFKMAGGGQMNVSGVFMVPNATPFTVTGTGDQDLSNAQFITRKFAVDGGAILTMRVDPYNSVTLPDLGPFLLVR